jgi:hypothetical protein
VHEYTLMCMLPSLPLVRTRLLPKFSTGIPGGITLKVYTLLFTFGAQSISAHAHTFSPPPPRRFSPLSEVDVVDVYFTQENVGLSVCPSVRAVQHERHAFPFNVYSSVYLEESVVWITFRHTHVDRI